MTHQEQSAQPRLLAIVGVPPEERVLCGQPGCGHSVYAEIHVVQDGGRLLVLGSTCFAKRYGSAKALGQANYGSGGGRQLTPEERLLLVENTAELLAQFERERQRAVELARAQVEATRSAPQPRLDRPQSFPSTPFQWSASPRGASANKPLGPVPWTWMKAGTSMGYFKLNDGTGWVRVQHKEGQQMLAPWPVFDGWDEALPSHVGPPDLLHGAYALRDVAATVAYLRRNGVREKVSGLWREIVLAAEAG
jgi:hypothetical protein